MGRDVAVGAAVAESVVGAHAVGAVWMDAPVSALSFDSEGQLHAAAVAVSHAGAFELDVVEPTTHNGRAAIDAQIHRGTMDGDALILLDGGHVVAVYVLGTTHGGEGYDHLRHSLVLS